MLAIFHLPERFSNVVDFSIEKTADSLDLQRFLACVESGKNNFERNEREMEGKEGGKIEEKSIYKRTE